MWKKCNFNTDLLSTLFNKKNYFQNEESDEDFCDCCDEEPEVDCCEEESEINQCQDQCQPSTSYYVREREKRKPRRPFQLSQPSFSCKKRKRKYSRKELKKIMQYLNKV